VNARTHRLIGLSATLLLVTSLSMIGCDRSSDETSEMTGTEKSKQTEDKQAAESEEPEPEWPATAGFVTATTEQSVLDTRDTVEGALAAKSGKSILARVDFPSQIITHFGDAPDNEASPDKPGESAGETDASGDPPPPASVFVVSEPNMEIPLVDASQSAGLDLPQTIAIWRSGSDETSVGFSAPAYLTVRHAIEGAELILMKLGSGMEKLLSSALGLNFGDFPSSEDIDIEEREGVETIRAYQGPSETADRLEKAVKQSESFRFVERVNHTENASSLEQSVRPIQTVFALHIGFGRALYKASPSILLDYPFRLAARSNNDGEVQVVYSNPEFLAERHQLENEDLVENATDAIEDVADEAAQGGEDEE